MRRGCRLESFLPGWVILQQKQKEGIGHLPIRETYPNRRAYIIRLPAFLSASVFLLGDLARDLQPNGYNHLSLIASFLLLLKNFQRAINKSSEFERFDKNNRVDGHLCIACKRPTLPLLVLSIQRAT